MTSLLVHLANLILRRFDDRRTHPVQCGCSLCRAFLEGWLACAAQASMTMAMTEQEQKFRDFLRAWEAPTVTRAGRES